MNNVLEESGILFDFSACDAVERFDVNGTNPTGMKSVDFLAESADCLYFVEIKNFENPRAPQERRQNDYKMLVEAGTEKKSFFTLEMGEKIKDSLLRRYALGNQFTKKVVYLLFIHLDKLSPHERGRLAEKITGHIPIGLNHHRFDKFHKLEFALVNSEELKQYGIIAQPLELIENN
jgi:hypothetical protein